MKKIVSTLVLWFLLFASFYSQTHATETGYFRVTAYYSPLPNQEAYIMGSYAAELRMNGMWIAWAGWKWVFAGMLAAPQGYSFWTKIYLDWVWIWEVADRGWAIVPAGQRGFQNDRIDIWMWYGNEWLRRAMYWWNRVIKWSIVASETPVTINLQNHPAPAWATAKLKRSDDVFSHDIGKHSSLTDIKNLQEFLKTTGFYSWEIDWDYTSIESIIYSYQLQNKLVVDSNTLGAAYWGKLTRATFAQQYKSNTLKLLSSVSQVEKAEVKDITWTTFGLDEVAPETQKTLTQTIFETWVQTEDEIKKLQEILLELSYAQWEINGDYNSTKKVIWDYQIGKWIVESEQSVGYSYFWPKTRASLKQDYKTHLETKREIILEEQAEKIETQKQLQEAKEQLEILKNEISKRLESIGTPKFWDTSPQVRELQITLKELWFFEYKDTAIFGEKTKQSIFEYQKSKWLVNYESDLWAGMIGEKTLESIWNDLQNI